QRVAPGARTPDELTNDTALARSRGAAGGALMRRLPRNWLPPNHPLARGAAIIIFRNSQQPPPAPKPPEGGNKPASDAPRNERARERLCQKGAGVFVGSGCVTTGRVAEDQRPGEQVVLVTMHTCGCAGFEPYRMSQPATALRLIPRVDTVEPEAKQE